MNVTLFSWKIIEISKAMVVNIDKTVNVMERYKLALEIIQHNSYEAGDIADMTMKCNVAIRMACRDASRRYVRIQDYSDKVVVSYQI